MNPFDWLYDKKGPYWETFKFVLRLIILGGLPQLIAVVADNPGIWWANLLTLALPAIDKAWHESKLSGNGLLAF